MSDKIRVCLINVYVSLADRHGISHTPKNFKYVCLSMSNAVKIVSYSFQLIGQCLQLVSLYCHGKKVLHIKYCMHVKNGGKEKLHNYSLYHEPNSFIFGSPTSF